jgi:hypothetical protein
MSTFHVFLPDPTPLKPCSRPAVMRSYSGATWGASCACRNHSCLPPWRPHRSRDTIPVCLSTASKLSFAGPRRGMVSTGSPPRPRKCFEGSYSARFQSGTISDHRRTMMELP